MFLLKFQNNILHLWQSYACEARVAVDIAVILNGTPSPKVIKYEGYPKTTHDDEKNHKYTKTIN